MKRSVLILLALAATATAQLVRNGDFRVGANLEGWQPGAPAFTAVDDEGCRSPGSLCF